MSSKIKKFTGLGIRKITGGKDPVHLVEEFILRLGSDPEECAKEKTADLARWMVQLQSGEDLEILVEGLKVIAQTTVYLGINVALVPLRNSQEILTAALEVADGLVGIKVSLVGHYLVLSSTLGAAGISVEDLDYNYRLITAQEQWFKQSIAEELGWELVPEK